MAPFWLAALVLNLARRPLLDAHSGDPNPGGLYIMLSLVGFASVLAAIWIVVRAICEAEKAADVPRRPSAFITILQIIYLPLAAVLLYRRLEVLSVEPSAESAAAI